MPLLEACPPTTAGAGCGHFVAVFPIFFEEGLVGAYYATSSPLALAVGAEHGRQERQDRCSEMAWEQRPMRDQRSHVRISGGRVAKLETKTPRHQDSLDPERPHRRKCQSAAALAAVHAQIRLQTSSLTVPATRRALLELLGSGAPAVATCLQKARRGAVVAQAAN